MLLIYTSKTKTFEPSKSSESSESLKNYRFIYTYSDKQVEKLFKDKTVFSATELSDLFDAEIKKISLIDHFAETDKKEYPRIKILAAILKKIIETQTAYAMITKHHI